RGSEPGADGLYVFRRQRPGRPLFQQDACGAQPQRSPLPRSTSRRSDSSRSGDEAFPAPRRVVSQSTNSHAAGSGESRNKKKLILEAARALARPRYTPAEIEQIRRKLIASLGAQGKTSVDYIVSVLQEAGLRVVMSTKSDTEGLYEEEFSDLLHFSTLD